MSMSKPLLIALMMLVCCAPAIGVPVVYTGYDIGSTSLAASPLATAAAAAFDGATGPLSLIDFETGIPVGVTLSAPNIVDESSCFTPDLHCYATSGTKLNFQSFGQTFTFATAIDSFGAYFTGWQLDDQTITINYFGGGQVVLNMGSGDFSGGTRFFGFTDVGTSITSVVYDSPGDAVGIDDVRYGKATAVPEPSILILLSTGLVAVVAYRQRAKTKPDAA